MPYIPQMIAKRSFFIKSLFSFLVIFISISICFSVEIISRPIDKILNDSIFAVYYDSDDRYDILEYPISLYKDFAHSTAGLVYFEFFKQNSDGNWEFPPLSLREVNNLCPEERFGNQLVLPSCTGFLIAPDTIMTAAHCIDSTADCSATAWVFDFNEDRIFSNIIENENVYFCENVSFPDSELDYAIIRLNRVVSNRTPLQIRTSGKIESDSELVVIGHSSNLGTKIADNAFILDNENEDYFLASLDTFSGNSGSPVFNYSTGLVEGLLSAGAIDYVKDYERNCYMAHQCYQESCNGEKVIRITKTKALSFTLAPE